MVLQRSMLNWRMGEWGQSAMGNGLLRDLCLIDGGSI